MDIDLDIVKKKAHLVSCFVSWMDPNKYPVRYGDVLELEYLLPGDRSLRTECSSIPTMLSPFGPAEKPTRGRIDSALYTDEDGIGYRIWNRKTGELLAEEMLPHPSAPPQMELSGGPAEGLRFKVDRKVTSIVAFCSTDQGQSWRPLPIADITGKNATPSRMLPSEASIRTGGMLVEIEIMVGLKPYRERFQMDGAETELKNPNWKRLQGEHPHIQQKSIVTVVQDKDR